MIKRWTIDSRLDNHINIIHNYNWDETGFHLTFGDYNGIAKAHISFPCEVELVQIKYLASELLCNDSVYDLMLAANCEAPLNPFFIQTNSEIATEVVGMSYTNEIAELVYGKNPEKPTQYIMITDDFWINVFSFDPPTVTVEKN